MRCVLQDATGREISRAEGPGAVAAQERPRLAAAAVAGVVRSACASGGVTLPGGGLWAGLSGAGREAASRAVTEELERAGLADRVRVGSDVDAAFHAAFSGGPGLLLIAGTGSIALARNARGKAVRVGGWGRHIGDEGSGYALGLGALKSVARAEDGRAAPTVLRDAVLARVGADAADALIPWVASAAKADVASLAPLVTSAAERGDRAAEALIERALSDLLKHVATALERSGPWPDEPELVLWGGLVGRGKPLRAPLIERLEGYPVAVMVDREPDPASGAASMALDLLRESGPGGSPGSGR